MQQKHGLPKLGILLGILGCVLLGVVIALMNTTIPAPQKPIEKELDAKAFLESKPQQ